MIEEIIKVTGEVVVTVTNTETGEVVQTEKQNLVVNNGKTILAKLLGHDAAYINDFIDKIAFGTGNTAAASTQTALVAQVLTKAAAVTYPAFNQVQFSATMTGSEGGTNTFAEIALLSNTNNRMFSRLVISPITKSTLYQIQVDWTISFQ